MAISSSLQKAINDAAAALPKGIFPIQEKVIADSLSVLVEGLLDNTISALDWQESVLDKDLAVAPAGVAGARYIVGGLGGDWATFTVGDIAEYDGTAWQNETPTEGMATWIEDENLLYVWTGAAWESFLSTLPLADGNLFVGSAGGFAAGVAMGGEASIVNTGAVTLDNGAVIGKVLTGFASGAGVVAAADSILAAIQKVDGNEIAARGRYRCMNVVNNVLLDDNWNVDGLASALLLAEALRTHMDAHAADAADHTTAVDNVNFPLASPTATELVTLIALVTEMLLAYDAHDDDAELGALWAYHAAQEAGDHSLASTVAPTTLAECITRLNDIKAKYNGHDADATCHGVGSNHQEATADAANGNSATVADVNAVAGDLVSWSVLDGGVGPKVGVDCLAGTGEITFQFDAPPVSDTRLSYSLFRAI